MKDEILKLLGYQPNSTIDNHIGLLIDKALCEAELLSDFRYVYAFYEIPQPFMLENQSYVDYLEDAEGYLLCASTLGMAVDKRLKRLQLQDMAYAVVFDATANVLLESKADEYEKQLPFPQLGFRFCPGYAHTSINDNKLIHDLLHAEKIGITFLDSGLMLPLKSMVGIVKIGGAKRKSCENCVAAPACQYKKRGTTCYSL